MTASTKNKEDKPKTCGLVMPISALEGCSEQHWLEVREILEDAIRQAGLEPNLVSNADDVGIIQKRIIQNLYSNPLVVCDVSGKNPNVMFELGMRLAFDKPTLIVKDDKTSYSFDTSPIEHIEYPRDLRFSKIVDFKTALKDKLEGTLRQSGDDPNYTTFLKHFGKFTVAKLETTEVSKEDFILEELSELRRNLQMMYRRSPNSQRPPFDMADDIRERLLVHHLDSDECKHIMKNVVKMVYESTSLSERSTGLLRQPEFIADRARKLGIMPDCFRKDSDTCLKMIRKAINEVKGEQDVKPDKQ